MKKIKHNPMTTTEKLYKNIRGFLGGPLREIELEDSQIDIAYEDAKATFEMYRVLNQNAKHFDDIKDTWIDKYTLANCKEILGRVRGKFNGNVGSPEIQLTLEYQSLLNESSIEKNTLINLL
jgi:hypothetical protein